jgi:hypothetical protein
MDKTTTLIIALKNYCEERVKVIANMEECEEKTVRASELGKFLLCFERQLQKALNE